VSQYPNDISGGVGLMRQNQLGLGGMGGGIQQNVGVQGFSPIPPDARGSDIANALGESLGLFGRLAGSIRDQQERQLRAQEAEDRKVEQFDRGAAVKAAADTYAELAPQIADKKLIAAVDDAQLGSYVNDLLAPRAAGQSKAWQEEFDKQLHGRLLHAFGEQRAGIKKEARDTAIDMAKWRAIGANGDSAANDVRMATQSLRDTFGMSEIDAHASTTIPAMRLAAEQGDRAKFEAAALTLPDGMFTDEVARGETKLAAARQANQEQDWNKNANDFAAWYEKDPKNLPPAEQAFAQLEQTNLSPAARGMWRRRIEEEQSQAVANQRQTVEDQVGAALNSGSIDTARSVIDSNRKVFGDEWANNQVGHVAAWENQQVQARMSGWVQAETAKFNSDVYATSMRAYASGAPGVSMLPEDVKVNRPDGKVETLKTKDAVEAVRPQVFAAFDRQFQNPVEALAHKVKWAASNGVDVPEWTAAMKGGAMSATEDNLKDPATAKSAVGGYVLWKHLMAQDPAMTSRLAGKDANELYDVADGLMASTRTMANGRVVEGDPAAALLQASKMIADPGYPKAKARADDAMGTRNGSKQPTLLEQAGAKLGSTRSDVLDFIQQQARPLIIGGTAPEAALDEVVRRYKDSVVAVGGENNRQLLFVNQTGFTPAFVKQIPTYAENLIAEFAAGEGKKQGYDAADLSLKFDPRNSVFYLVDRTGMSVRSSGGVLSTSWDAAAFQKAGIESQKRKIVTEGSRQKAIREAPIDFTGIAP